MKIANHLGKISWSLADKGLFIIYGLVSLIIYKYSSKIDLGYYALLLTSLSWFVTLTDSFCLQSLIHFGYRDDNRKVNLMALTLHSAISITGPLLLYIISPIVGPWIKSSNYTLISYHLLFLALLSIPRSFLLKIMFRDRNMFKVFLTNLSYFAMMIATIMYYVVNFHNMNYENLFYVNCMGLAFSSFVAIILNIKQLRFSTKGEIKFKELIKFSTPNMFGSSLHTIPRMLDAYVIQYFFGESVLGVYSLVKQLYRVFEETLNAANGLTYPAALKQLASGDKAGLRSMITKAISFMGFLFLACVIALNLGLTEFILHLFDKFDKFAPAVGQFNILSITSLFLPFLIIPGIMVASNKIYVLIKYINVSLVIWLVSFAIIGYLQLPNLIAVPQLTYGIALGLLTFNHVRKEYDVRFTDLLRAVPDSINFIKKLAFPKSK